MEEPKMKTIGTFAKVLDRWRGKRKPREAATTLGLDYPTFRKYASGKRTPPKSALAGLQKRMN